MKIRTDFVTNSSSSCYVIKLQIRNTDDDCLEFSGRIDETSNGYLNSEGTIDPRIIAKADSVDDLKEMLSSFKTLCETNYEIKNSEGEKIDWWSPSEIPGCPEDYDEYDGWYYEIVCSEGIEGYVFDGFLKKIDEKIQSMNDVKAVSVECDSEEADEDTRVYEKHEYDRTAGCCSDEYQATEYGEDVTDQMLNNHYSIDLGEDILEFQLRKYINR